MEFRYSDGGRSAYFKKENVGDCVTRAIANATGKDYKEVYDGINELAKKEHKGSRKRGKSSARDGVYRATIKKYIEGVLGWEWHPTMQIGSGCTTHLTADELPKGNLIVSVSRHLTCVKDGTIYDTYDCSREGNRCVYGYWTAPKPKPEPVPQMRVRMTSKTTGETKTYGCVKEVKAINGNRVEVKRFNGALVTVSLTEWALEIL